MFPTVPPMTSLWAESAVQMLVPGDAGVVYGGSSLPCFPAESLVADWIFDASAPVLSSPNIADIDGDSVWDIVLTTYGKGPDPYSSGYVYVLDTKGDALPGWPKQTSAPFPASAVVGDIDGDGDAELVAGDWSSAYVWNGDGSLLPGWPKWVGTYVTPSLADLDKDGDLEIIYCGTGNRLYVWQADGSSMPGWPFASPELVGSPAVADIDNDGTLEIIAATYRGPVGPDPFQVYAWETDGSVVPGFPVSTPGVNKSAPAIGDIDNDDSLEIVVASYHTSNLDYIYVLDSQGNIELGWPVRANYVRLSSPALGDLDGDDDLEVLIGGYDPARHKEQVFAYHHDGASVNGWPVVLDHPGAAGNINSSIIIADVDGTHPDYETYWPVYKRDFSGTGLLPPGGIPFNEPEILIKAVDHIYALHPDGSLVSGFPYFLDDESHTGTYSPSPAVADMDGDGGAELVFTSCIGKLAFFDYEPVGVSEEVVPARSRGHALVRVRPNPFSSFTMIDSGDDEDGGLEIYDVSGRRVAQFSESHVRWHGDDAWGRQVPGGIYFVVPSKRTGSQSAKIVLLR